VVGYFVLRERLGSAQQMASLTKLLGTDARLLIGNMSGDLWTDFRTQVTGLPAELSGSRGLVAYHRNTVLPVFAHAAPVPGTPWAVVLEVPQAPVLAPVRRFVARAVVLAVVLALGGATIGWILSRRLTNPLRRMTAAAEAIATDRSSERIGLRRSDELGRLAAAFDTMVAHLDDERRRLKASEDALRLVNGELEQRVEARIADLQAANHELEAFSYSVSHDLRAPLRAIGGFSQVLLEDYADALPPDARRHLDVIARNTTAMGQLIDDLLTFSRLSRQPMARGRTDMTALVRSSARDIQRAEPGRSFEFVLGALPPAHAEPSLVKHVIDNLMQNAAKFTRTRDGARIEIGHTMDQNQTVYFVRDNGVGFDMKYADKLFGVFQRLHRAADFEGTGVGLAIVHRIVSRHGGRAWADSAVGCGATFFFTLPEGMAS